jgi:hypothetical protein
MVTNAYWFFDDLVVVHITGEETEGRFSSSSSSCHRTT